MTDPLRASYFISAPTPGLVEQGQPAAGSLVVFDPAGAANHDELPASWRPLAHGRHIIWCRLPHEGALSDMMELLADHDALTPPVDVLTSGPVAETMMELLDKRVEAVRSLLLVDPAAGSADERQDAAAPDARWKAEHRDRLRALEERGVFVDIIGHSSESARDRTPPPLPLGHPDVVDAVTKVMEKLDSTR